MFAYFYQLCATVFMLQGISLPLLVIISGILAWKQNHKLERLKRELHIERGKKLTASEISELMLKSLPQLKPLNCVNCGAGILLKERETLCTRCETRGELPQDYAQAAALKWEVRRLFRSAVRHWRIANILTRPAVGWLFFLMIFAEPLVIFPVTLIGSNMFPDTWIDRTLKAFGEDLSFLIMLFAFFGFVIWMIVFIFLNGLSKSLRRKLPVVPFLEPESSGREIAECQACGGGIEYDSKAFVTLCSYCNVENYRAQFVRRARVQGEKQQTETKSVLFGAMEILDDFVGTFFIVTLLLVGSAMLLGIIYAVKNLL